MIIVKATLEDKKVELNFKSSKIAKAVRDAFKSQGWEAEAQSVKILD